MEQSLPILTVYATGRPTPLQPVYGPDSIRARLKALSLVAIYANRLYELANTTAPSEFQSAATALDHNLSTLDKTFKDLKDPTASQLIQPVNSLIGTTSEMFQKKKRSDLISKAVADGAPTVEAILSHIRTDLELISLSSMVGSSEKVMLLVFAYNRDRKTLTYEQRMARASEIKAAANEMASNDKDMLTSLITAMMEAHKTLIQEVTSSTRSRDANVAALNAALDQWTTQLWLFSVQTRLSR